MTDQKYVELTDETWAVLRDEHTSELRKAERTGLCRPLRRFQNYDFEYVHNTELSRCILDRAHFESCRLEKKEFKYSNLSDACFSDAIADELSIRCSDIHWCRFVGCSLKNAQFWDVGLEEAKFINCDLSGAHFYTRGNTGWRGVNFCGSLLTNVTGLPEAPYLENIDQQILAALERPHCYLNMNAWHTCETMHCRAGWAIHLAGEEGQKLANAFGNALAGALIYVRSRPELPVPDWYTSNLDAMADIKKRAELTTAG